MFSIPEPGNEVLAGLILLCPVVLGRGKTMFEGIQEKLTLKLTKTRAFPKGNVLLSYEAMA
jgi:hypothetical protein